jgi:hypothetical protein
MTVHLAQCDTRTGGHSAKNAHRPGAPNPQQTSGEATMVNTVGTSGDLALSDIRARLGGQSYRFLLVSGDGRLGVNFDALADLVAEICAEQTALGAERRCSA